MKREFDPEIPELMDLAVLENGNPSAELERDLANLRWLNRHFGAYSILYRFLKRWFLHRLRKEPPLRVLDLATGEGDLPRQLVLWCRIRGIPVTVDAIDSNEATLSVARKRSRDFPEITFHQGDIRNWGFSSESWELVLCSLALHHFSDKDAILVMINARRLSSHHLLIADLERNLLGAFGIWLLTALLLREPMTKHDARLSIRRAFSFDECRSLAREAGWEDFGHARFPITRQALWIDQISR